MPDHVARPLNARTLKHWQGILPVPSYDRGQVTAGIVHVGVGGFHRAHQAMYLDRLMNAGIGRDWAVSGVGLMPADRLMKEALNAQDGLYTLVQKQSDGRHEPSVIGSLVRYLFAPDDPDQVIEAMAAEQTRIVSLTITEGGYNIDDATGEFDTANQAVVRDLAPGTMPRTVYGIITEALRRRRERRLAPFSVMSCDNLPGNGHLSRTAVSTFAHMRDPELGDWVESEVSFPNSMVDRITPATTEADKADVRDRFGIDDLWPVVCEPYTQWVLEDAFPAGRPPVEEVGVQVVADVQPYELMKLRLLNGAHQAMCYFACLAGYQFVHEAAQDPQIRAFLLGYMAREAAPTLPPVPGIDLDAYQRELIERFSNPQIRDTIARLCAQTSDRIPKFVLPVVRQQLASDGDIRRSAAVIASWARYAEGVDDRGRPIEIVDRLADHVRELARRQRTEPTAFIASRELFGSLSDSERFVAAYRETLATLHERGALATLRSLS